MGEGQTEMSQVLSLLQQLRQQVTDQQSQITQTQAVQTRVRGESELSGIIQDLRNQTTAGSSSTNPTMTVDTRSIGKPDSFKGDPKEYADWSFVFKAYMSCISTRYIELFERIESSRVPTPNRLMGENDRALSTQMYYVLAMLVKNRPLDLSRILVLVKVLKLFVS